MALVCSSFGLTETAIYKPVIVLDFGGVMADFDLSEMLKYCAEEFDMTLGDFTVAIKQDIDKLACGEMEEEVFWNQLVANQPPSKWEERYKIFIKKLVSPRKDMYALVSDFRKRGFQVVLFSDVTQWQAEVFDELGLYNDFSFIMLSYQKKARKPYENSYKILLKELGIEPEQCIFIDDRLENIEAAKKLKIKGILYTSFEEVKASLNKAILKN